MKYFLLIPLLFLLSCYKSPVDINPQSYKSLEVDADNFEFITYNNIDDVKTIKLINENQCYELEGIFIVAKPVGGRCNPNGCIIKTQGNFVFRYYSTGSGQLAAREIINSHGINEIDLYDGTNGCGPTGTDEPSVCHRQTWGLRFDAPNKPYADSVLTLIASELDSIARIDFDASNCPSPN